MLLSATAAAFGAAAAAPMTYLCYRRQDEGSDWKLIFAELRFSALESVWQVAGVAVVDVAVVLIVLPRPYMLIR
jgi:hypothetical protein